MDSNLCRKTGIFLLAVRWRQPEKEKSFFRRMESMGYTFWALQRYLEDETGGAGKRSGVKTSCDTCMEESCLETLPCIFGLEGIW